MGTNYRPYEPDQPFLFPPSPRDWLPQDHLAYFISDTLDQLDLSALHQPYQGDGRRNQPYHPTMLVKVLVYAYATGVFSSRKIADKLIDDVALRLLAAGNQPDFRTINRFRQQHLETFGKLFVELVQLAQKMGLVKLGTVALDGTKIKANASKHKAMSYQRMKEEEQRLEEEIQQLLEKAQQTDAAEDELLRPRKTAADELPARVAANESSGWRQIRAAKAGAGSRAGGKGQAKRARARRRQGGFGDETARRVLEIQAGVWRAGAESATQFQRSREPHHEVETEFRAVLQRAGGGGRRQSVDRGASRWGQNVRRTMGRSWRLWWIR